MTANILVVDDLEPNVKLLEAKLLNEYYTVFTANSGLEAIELLTKNKIDIILLDVMMPGLNGFETCMRVKANPDTTHIPVVMVTALSDTEDRVKGLEAGADEFLTKPIDDTALFARVRSLSRMKAVIDELNLRNNTNAALGGSAIEMIDDFVDKKILLINDDLVQAKNISKMLLKISSQIKIIHDIQELVNDFEYIPDLVIISCQLEGSDPLRISVMLRGNSRFHDVVLILLAEEENIPMVMKGMELGVNDYFIYPVEVNELLARVRTQLRRKQYQDNLRNNLERSVNLSIKDGLTGVFNRRYFDIHIQQMMQKALENKRPLSLLMCDIDHFKEVNDTYGHQAGDAVLKAITDTLKSTFRVTDLIARFGGEEFVILLSDLTLEQTLKIAGRLCEKISEVEVKINTQGEVIKKTISVGVTEYKSGESATEFIERSDKAMYEAKNAGRNMVINL